MLQAIDKGGSEALCVVQCTPLSPKPSTELLKRLSKDTFPPFSCRLSTLIVSTLITRTLLNPPFVNSLYNIRNTDYFVNAPAALLLVRSIDYTITPRAASSQPVPNCRLRVRRIGLL